MRRRGKKASRPKARRARSVVTEPKPSAQLPSLPTTSVTPGRPIYRDAGRGRRVEGFFAPETGPLSAVIANGQVLRARSRALHRQNSWARNARRTFAANVGPITPKFRFEPDGWGRSARDLWDEWTLFADAAGLGDFYNLENQIVGECFEAGEIFIRRRTRLPEDELPVPLQLQLIESEHVPYWYTMPLPNGGWIKAGIEFDPIGRRAAYWMYPHHPGEYATSFSMDGYTLRRIPAEQIIHVFVPERAEAVRGVPFMSSSLLRLWGLDEYDDAELDRKRIAANIGGVITLMDPDKAGDKIGELHTAAMEGRGGGPFTEMEPATIPVLGPGEDFKQFEAADVGSNYLPFHQHNHRGVSCDSWLTYEMFTGDLSQTSYVSLRFGSIEFRKRCRMFQRMLTFQFHRAALAWWMDLAVMSGALAASGYEADAATRRRYQRVLWVPPAWDRIQPDKEVPADIDACRAGFTTSDRVVAERLGEDGAVIDEEQAEINARKDRLGLISDADPRQGAAPAGSRARDTGSKQSDTPAMPPEDARPNQPMGGTGTNG